MQDVTHTLDATTVTANVAKVGSVTATIVSEVSDCGVVHVLSSLLVFYSRGPDWFPIGFLYTTKKF